MRCTWAFALYPINARSTRLVTRVRASVCYRDIMRATPVYSWPTWLLLDPGAFIMERKMLSEMKRLAESSQMTPYAGVNAFDGAVARMETSATIGAAVPG